MLWRNVTESRDSANERGSRRTLPSYGGFVRVMKTASWFTPSAFSFPGDGMILGVSEQSTYKAWTVSTPTYSN